MTTSTAPSPEPSLVKIEGLGFLLYTAGIKRGHAESCEEQAENMDRIAQTYRDSHGDAGEAGATLFDNIAAELRQAAGKAKAQGAEHMHHALAMLQRRNERELASRAPVARLSPWDRARLWLARLRW